MILGATIVKKRCQKCGHLGLRFKRACCAERRRGVKGTLSCRACGHKEIFKK